jgi:hypothetical protein
MANKTRYADHTKEWEEILAAVKVNASELPQLQLGSEKLGKLLGEFRDLEVQQAVHQANKQQVSKRLQVLMTEGKKVASMMRAVIREHYGNQNEKLVEFGVSPLRTRSRKPASPVEPPSEEPVPPSTE